jgi:hypothetical protein
MAGTILNFNDVQLLLQGKVLYREASGAPASPASGNLFTRKNAIEIMINESDLDALHQMINPKFWEPPHDDPSSTEGEPEPKTD